MFEKGDIVTFKDPKGKYYRRMKYEVISVSKRNKYIWVKVPFKPRLFWKLNQNDLIKIKER